MKPYLLFILLLISLKGFSQDTLTEQQLKQVTDSILKEADLLYKFERAAWVSTDLAMENKAISKNYGGYLVYLTGDTVKTIIIDAEKKSCIYDISFVSDFDKPIKKTITTRVLSSFEENLLLTKNAILTEIDGNDYEIYCPENYSLNIVIMPNTEGYKLYILTGTSQSEIIPFGNDYLFLADESGKIIGWKKFHSRLIPIQTVGPKGEVVKQSIHSHLKEEPFITATDICTFRLYASLYNQKEFKVYSPALSKYFTYKLDENIIIVTNK